MATHKTIISRVILFTGTAISLYFVPWPIVWAWLPPLPDTVQQQVDKGPDMGFDGIIVYVDQGGQAPAFYGAGWKNRAEKIPADPGALFKIGSLDKLYLAVSIVKLVNRDKFSLDGTLAEYFPELKGKIENADKITIRMMLQHRSGIPNFTDTKDFWANPPESKEEALALIYGMPSDFPPGEDHAYCNTNYLLLKMLIEKITGNGFFQFIRGEILEPLKITNTYPSIHTINMDDLMSGYYVGIEEDIKTTDYGAMIATTEDVGTFIRALNHGSVFEGDELKMYASLYDFGHGGLIPGYMTYAYYHEDIDAVVVQVVNTTNFSGYEWNLHQVMYNRIVNILRKNN
jgi:CubicO group peptidase (beta-lactamase class C family)